MIIEVLDRNNGGKKEVNIKGLVLDIDGLLFDSERVVQRAWSLSGEELGFGQDFGNHIYHTIGFNVKRREAYFRANVSSDFPMQLFGDTWETTS